MADVYDVPGIYNIKITRGETYQKTFTFPYDISSYTFQSKLRNKKTLADVYTNTVTQSNANKTVTITVPKSTTDDLSLEKNLYDWYLRQVVSVDVQSKLIIGEVVVCQ